MTQHPPPKKEIMSIIFGNKNAITPVGNKINNAQMKLVFKFGFSVPLSL